MKQVHLLGNGKLAVREVPVPEPKDGWVLVKLRSIPICGSDVKPFLGERAHGPTGHEGAGEVVESKASLFKPGDRVIVPTLGGCGYCEMCQQGDCIHCTAKSKDVTSPTQSEYVTAPARLTLRIPEGLAYEEASLAGCALAPAFGALRRIGASPGQWVMVTGVGPVGLGAAFIAKRMGLRALAVDRQQERLNLARRVGAEATLRTEGTHDALRVLQEIGGRPRAVLECSGAPPAQRLAFDAVGAGGHIAFIGAGSDAVSVVTWQDFCERGVTAFGQWHATMLQLGELLSLLVAYRQDLHLLITHRLPLDRAQEAYDLMAARTTAKVMLTVN